jgi:hypothetical protein
MPDSFWWDAVSNCLGGVAAAILIGLYLWFVRDRPRKKRIEDLVDVMGRTILHRNIGERQPANRDEWVEKAKALEVEAIRKANDLSIGDGALVEWLDRITPHHSRDPVDHYLAILDTVIERLRGIIERNT